MAKRQPLSASETDLMKALWRREQATVPELVEALNEQRAAKESITRGTVQVLLNRVEHKGWVDRRKEGRGYLYSPTTGESAGMAELASDFQSKVFDGSSLNLVQALVKTQGLRREDIDELRALLDQAEADLGKEDELS